MMAPATSASLNPNAWPMPNRATPTVATVDHELPVATEMMAEMMAAAGRK